MKEKITFDETTANEIIERFNLPKSNLAKWKFRGHIPPQYFEKQSEEIKQNDSMYPKILEILTYKEIALTKFRTFNKRPQRASDLISERFRMSIDEKTLFVTEVTEIRNTLIKCAKIFDEKNIKTIIKDMRIHHTYVLPQTLLSSIHQNYFNLNKFDKIEINEMKQKILVLHNKLLLQ